MQTEAIMFVIACVIVLIPMFWCETRLSCVFGHHAAILHPGSIDRDCQKCKIQTSFDETQIDAIKRGVESSYISNREYTAKLSKEVEELKIILEESLKKAEGYETKKELISYLREKRERTGRYGKLPNG